MLRIIPLTLKIFLVSIVLFLPDLIAATQLFSEDDQKVRVAIVYSDSKTGKRYKDGIMEILNDTVVKEKNLELITVPYDKSEHGEDTIKKLILNDHADVILGPTDSQVFIKVHNTDGIQDKKVSVISGMATTNIGNDSQGYFFKLNLEALERISGIWDYLDMFMIKNVAVIYEKSEFGKNAESAYKKLLGYSGDLQDYTSMSFVSPFQPSSELYKMVEKRPEAIGLFCGRDEIPNINRVIQSANKSGVPYHPYFFTLIDITTVSKGLNNFYFPSLQSYTDSTIFLADVQYDEVKLLGKETGKLLLGALEECGSRNKMWEPSGRINFRNKVVSILRGESNKYLTMKFIKMKNVGPPNLFRVNNDIVYRVESDMEIHWFNMIQNKAKLLVSVHDYKLIFNVLLMIILTISVSITEIRRSFPKKHVKFYRTNVFYLFLFAHLLLVSFLYIYLAESGRISYYDTLMVIIITITPSAFFKTTFFESKSGRSFGLEDFYKRIMASIDAQIMKSRYQKLVGLENVIAYSNSEDSMKEALLRIYRNNPSKAQAAKLIQKMEETLSLENDYMERKRAAAQLIMRQFDKGQLMAEGFVPTNWDYDDVIDPVILIRHAARYCAADKDRLQKLKNLLAIEEEELKDGNSDRYKEMLAVHNKELSITMSKEGELLVKLRFLMVLRGFNLKWLLDEKIITEEMLEQIRILSKPYTEKNRSRLRKLLERKNAKLSKK